MWKDLLLLLRPRFVLAFLTVAVLLVPLILPEYTSPALIPGATALAHNGMVILLALLLAAAVAWRYPGGPTGIAAALYILALVHVMRMVDGTALAGVDLPVRIGLAAAVVLATAGALHRWPSAQAGYALIGGAAALHVAGMIVAARGGASRAIAADCDLVSSAAGAHEPKDLVMGGAAAASSGSGLVSSKTDADPINMVPVKVSVRTLPEEEAAPRQAPFAGTLEEHMVQIRAPPNKTTVNWNSPAYGPALGVGTRAALGSFKSDVSDISGKMAAASGIYL